MLKVIKQYLIETIYLKKNDAYGIVWECVRPVKGHFRVARSLCFKARLCVKPLIWKWHFIPMHWNKTLRVLPFVKTERTAPSRRNENFTFNQNYPARSVKSWMVCTKKMVFQQKLLEKPISFSNWLVLQWSGRPVLTNGLSALSFVLKVRVFGTRKLLVTSFLYHEIPQQLTYPKTTFFRRYFALNALKENRIQVFRFHLHTVLQ